MLSLKEVKKGIGLYARVSSEKQALEETIKSQIADIIEHARTLNEVIDPELHFIDNGLRKGVFEEKVFFPQNCHVVHVRVIFENRTWPYKS